MVIGGATLSGSVRKTGGTYEPHVLPWRDLICSQNTRTLVRPEPDYLNDICATSPQHRLLEIKNFWSKSLLLVARS